MVCFVISAGSGEELVFSGDTLFRDSVGGGDFELDQAGGDGRLHGDAPRAAPPPGPHRRVDDRPGVGREPVHPRLARRGAGRAPNASPCAAQAATLIVWSPDYDGKGKAWVRFDDGADAIVGGSSVVR